MTAMAKVGPMAMIDRTASVLPGKRVPQTEMVAPVVINLCLTRMAVLGKETRIATVDRSS